MNRKHIFKLTFVAAMGVLGFILMMYNFPIPFLIPTNIKFDFSEIASLITSFVLGPIYGVGVCLVKNILNFLFTSDTKGIGEIANFILGSSLAFTAGCIYRYVKNVKGAIAGCIIGSIIMGLISIPVNFYITYPLYLQKTTMENIIVPYKNLNGNINTLMQALLIFNAPFTFLKGIAASIVTILSHNKIMKAIKQFI